MVVTVITMAISSILVAAALSAANDDVTLVRNDLDQKKAYYAAQAGISDYAFHLNQDVNYWTYCTNVPAPNAVNQDGPPPIAAQFPGPPTRPTRSSCCRRRATPPAIRPTP